MFNKITYLLTYPQSVVTVGWATEACPVFKTAMRQQSPKVVVSGTWNNFQKSRPPVNQNEKIAVTFLLGVRDI